MGAKQSTSVSSPRFQASGGSANRNPGTLGFYQHRQAHAASSGSSMMSNARDRIRSLSGVISGHSSNSFAVRPDRSSYAASGSPESDSSTPAEMTFSRLFAAHSFPLHLVTFNGIKCPVCSKLLLPDDVECHLVICFTKPRINYNEDVLTEDKGECVICLEELMQGDTIARLPCLCIYHKTCIDSWFEVNRSCPEHPLD